MARFGILCPAASGHTNPMSALARELIARGHSIVFIGFPDLHSRIAKDFEFIACGAQHMPPGSLMRFIDRLSGVAGEDNQPERMREAAGIAEIMLCELPAAIEAARADALIIYQQEPAPHLVAKAMRIPFVTVANGLHMNSEPAVPPPMAPWRFDPSPAGIKRNLAAYRGIAAARLPVDNVLRAYARRAGLSAFVVIDEIWSDLCQVSQCIRSFDFPRRELPPSFHYCGPFREAEPPLAFDLPNDGRPLVFCSLGSLQGSRARLFHNVCIAAAELNLNLLIAHGGKLSDAQVARLPGRPMVHAHVPQRAILARSALAVTHAGLNTVLDALSCGTPLVALPILFEQPGIGARLQRSGAGEIRVQRRDAAGIRGAMEQVLAGDSYRANARRLSEDIRLAGGAGRAADLIEQAVGLRHPASAIDPAGPAQS